MQIFITILILLLMLGILIASHEAGHLVLAKAFNVYCLEYSIGFGPKLFSHKRKKGETEFSVRAFPLGGYVSMYGEGVELPKGVSIPENRSLSGVAPWKRALILFAGVFVNLILAFLFALVYATAFPTYYAASYFDTGYSASGTSVVTGEEGATAYCFWIKGEVGDYTVDSDTDRLYSPTIATDDSNNEEGFIVDCSASINDESYVAVFNYSSVVNDNALLSDLTFYSPKQGFYATAVDQALGLTALPDISSPYTLKANDALTLHLTLLSAANRDTKPSASDFQSARRTYALASTVISDGDNLSWSTNPLFTTSYAYYAPFGQRLLNGCRYFAYFFEAIGEGIASIFMGNWQNIGSIVAMGSVINQSSAYIGVGRTFFLYGGYLSLNLAVFNLLPFPGLDGWQLLVTAIESIFKKKIPEKAKNIVSFVGLCLLLVLSVVIIAKDIFSLVK